MFMQSIRDQLTMGGRLIYCQLIMDSSPYIYIYISSVVICKASVGWVHLGGVVNLQNI